MTGDSKAPSVFVREPRLSINPCTAKMQIKSFR